MRLLLLPIVVECRDTTPYRVYWRGRYQDVRTVDDTWVSRRQWWSDDEYRHYYRIHTDTAVMEIYRCRERWVLSRVAD